MKNNSVTASQIQSVTSFQDLMQTPFEGVVNALCWNRTLEGDFAEIVGKIVCHENMCVVLPQDLLALELTEQGQLAREIILNDLKILEEQGTAPVLNVIKNYERDEDFPFFPTDVYSFHVDRSPVPTDTILCTYYGASSAIIPNAEVTQKILIPEIRAALLELYEGEESEGFEAFLSDCFFDLHYELHPEAEPIHLGIGHLWKLAIDYPERKVLPCVHRAPKEGEGVSRLLLIC